MEFILFVLIVVLWKFWLYPILLFLNLFLPNDRNTSKHSNKSFSTPTKPKPKPRPNYTDSTPDPFKDLQPSTGWTANQFMSAEQKAEYLKSPTWNIQRILVKNRDNFKCKSCGSTYRLEVHHITYERLGAEDLSDLVLLCNSCHQQVHDLLGYDRTTTFDISILSQP